MAKSMEKTLKEIQVLVDQGNIVGANRLISVAARTRIKSADRVVLASLARRAGNSKVSVSLLSRRVRQGNRVLSQSTVLERAEYASALANLGAMQEASEIFSTFRPEEEPRSVLLHTLVLFNRWDYAGAIPMLERLVAQGLTNKNDRFAGTIRLAASYLRGANRVADAKALLDEILPEIDPVRHGIFYLNARLIQMEIRYMRTRDGQEALADLAKIAKQFPEHDNESLNVWRCVLELERDHGARPAREALRRVRLELCQKRLWLMVRTCDLYASAILRDENTFRRAFFGTPFPGFHYRIRQLWGENPPEAGAYFDWSAKDDAPNVPSNAPVLDIRNGSFDDAKAFLKDKQLSLRLMRALSTDFYRPLPVAELHEALYPNTHYDPTNSPLRIHIGVNRARQWLRANRVPLRILAQDGGYRFEGAGGCAIRVPNPENPTSVPPPAAIAIFIEKLRQLGNAPFSSKQVSKALDVSLRSALYELEKARTHGLLERTGKGPSTRYTIS